MTAISTPSRAMLITVDGVEWKVTTTLVPADTLVENFKSTYITSQPWCLEPNLSPVAGQPLCNASSQAKAIEFAAALGAGLGYPNGLNGPGEAGPYFAYAADTTSIPPWAIYTAAGTIPPGNTYQSFDLPSTEANTYATATRVTSDVPGPLPLLGGLAAFGWSRRLRRRVALPSRP